MAETISLAAEVRTAVGRGVKALRRSGKTPAIIYGRHTAPLPIQVETRVLANTLRKAGRNTLISLQVDGEAQPRMVLTREVQRDPIKRSLLHVDFYEVSLTETITASLRIIVVGEPEDVKSGAGVLIQERDTLEIECLPQDLIESVTIDVSKMKIDDAVRVKDIIVPPGIRFLEDPELEVLRVTRFTEAAVEEAAAVEPGEVEVIERGKKEEAEEEEG
ncbi:MAG: 50S ribosomal protein L25 [Thermoflexales bacterium]|nr:50S ribosomal protein L25 [Thermoflexales bacterium]MCS7324345.1 50S ribosomal protein L25 [Thermoflexales bacterium]MCX7937915.1 50S ribosomal protein L25 [Thermoflexales bacterium]MDW8054847.1 50S ribosomal protein L25 [Anaerolineae bacterium]MDW8293052.1 50S ribosomal protein L25 [Anaerolineae bacterium]